ncbi:MAG TPA: HEPN domain-containing protein [Candidatus Latescibacteria bacterium]|nr:HEPN domain-containing protein [Candidatus Latescibacterota bacterium]HRS95208.1 HEPN domain-containing protein [Candidatus Latescibacterota bacterium]
MNEVVREWVTKAEGDFRTASRECRARQNPNFDAVCFHAQQCVEKLMKAALISAGLVPPKTHDLEQLDRLLKQTHTRWDVDLTDLRYLARASVAFRYPGESAQTRRKLKKPSPSARA